MNRPDTRDLIAKALRDSLSEAEKREWDQRLSADPALRAEFAEEQALERALDHLPDVPISSNFTALTIQAATRAERPKQSFWNFRTTFPAFARVAAVFTVACAVGLGIGVRYRSSERAELAQKVRSFTQVASLLGSSVSNKTHPEELFQNFEAIQRLPSAGDGDLDMDLLVALQK
jgi:anti-sigma factor RsiW